MLRERWRTRQQMRAVRDVLKERRAQRERERDGSSQ